MHHSLPDANKDFDKIKAELKLTNTKTSLNNQLIIQSSAISTRMHQFYI